MNDASINEHYSGDHDRLDDCFHRFQTLKPSKGTEAKAFSDFKAGLEEHVMGRGYSVSVFRKGIQPALPAHRYHALGTPGNSKFSDAIAEKLTGEDFDTGIEEMGLQSVFCPHNHKEEDILDPTIDQVSSSAERADIFFQKMSPSRKPYRP